MSMKTKNKKPNAVLAAVIVLIVVVAALTALLFLLRGRSAAPQASTSGANSTDASSSEETDQEGELCYDGVWYNAKTDLETILLMGIDKFEDNLGQTGYINSQQADFMLLLIFDRQADTCTALQLNRDIMTNMKVLGVYGDQAGTTYAQLALAHTYGSGGSDSCINTTEAVSDLLYGVKIDHYVSVTMDAVSVINDLAGGVTVTVLDDLSAIDPALVEGEEVTLAGSQALTYVRTRAGLENSTNLHRMERQQQYMLALWKQVNQRAKEDPDFLVNVLLQTGSYLQSDCSSDKLTELFEAIGDLDVSEILTLEGENVQGEVYMEYYVDEDALQQLVLQLFYTPVTAEEN
jgi:LCP family protein required for cell wall assembly